MTQASFGGAFGLVFRCGLPLSELTALEAAACDAEDIVDIELDADAPPIASEDSAASTLIDVAGDEVRLRIPGVACYTITRNALRVAPAAGADMQSVRTFLFGSAMGALLHLRGITVLHGSAVVTPAGDAAVLCGVSTAGKSTLAAALAQRGHALLADDMAAIRIDAQGRPWCLPGLARAKLWQHALGTLGMDGAAASENRVRPGLDKYSVNLPVADAPAPLKWLFELAVHAQGGLSFSDVTGFAKIDTLVNHTYRARLLTRLGGQGRHLQTVAALASRLAVQRIDRPRGEPTLEAIVHRLEGLWNR
jgi:hypothetical protein